MSALTGDPEYGSLGRIQYRSTLDLPLGSLVSRQVPGQRVPGGWRRRTRLETVIILVREICR